MTDLHHLTIPDEPGDAMAAALALRELADQVERKAVRQALADGWTWAQIAEALGVSKQAAHKKHAASLARG
ncbi:DNA-directed RNA polymerase specialized sigma24 family protein [Duganella sp. SG902]|uniref:helix-turn-helix domain-containing protein n=1 Tax=Duganella sp. SG902 TaxID=2587016 RepID=UPI00159D707A|nr:helix-turn-helix domain-containing protein [Duganella sp. SG902]NVM79419.1 DNA-directed RNA polymerase specialized sigma24 family protein [Duganella sp. SG902]